jgi:hypothetical protein
MARDVVDLRFWPVLGEHLAGALEDPGAVAAGVGPERAMSLGGGGCLRRGHEIFIRIA